MILSCRPEVERGCQNGVPYCGLPVTAVVPAVWFVVEEVAAVVAAAAADAAGSYCGRDCSTNLIYSHRSGLLLDITPYNHPHDNNPAGCLIYYYIAFLEQHCSILLPRLDRNPSDHYYAYTCLIWSFCEQ